MRLVVSLAIVLVAVSAHAACLIVHLPENAALKVTDHSPPPEGPRIDCPPTCAYEAPSSGVVINDLKVEPLLDPRNNDRPWDIIAMPGCLGTSALPADNALCFLPPEGDVDVSIQVQYRPILAVTYTGDYGAPLNFSINGNPGPNYNGSGSGFACYPNIDPQTGRCSAHLTAGQPVSLNAPSTNQATFVSASLPCVSTNCTFTLTGDTCIKYTYQNGDPMFFTTQTLSEIPCPTGPGTTPNAGSAGGSCGGGGGGGPPPSLASTKEAARENLRRLPKHMFVPCGVGPAVGLGLLAAGGPVGISAGAVILSAASPVCAIFLHDLYEWAKIVNDPPNFDFHHVMPIRPTARTPIDASPCDQLAGADRRACRKVAKALARYVAKKQHESDVLDALRTTVERASAAQQSGDQRALKKQLRAVDKRSRQIDAAQQSVVKAGAKLGSLLTTAGVTGSVNTDQFTQIATYVLGQLAQQGLPETDARTFLGDALTPTSIDLVTVLGEP